MADHYTYRVSWSEEDQEFVGTCIEFPSLSHLAESRDEALRGIEDLVRDVVTEMQASGEPPPTPIADQSFSGQFTARVPKYLHRRLAIEAGEAGVSLNRLVSFKLAMPVSDPQPTLRAPAGRPRVAAKAPDPPADQAPDSRDYRLLAHHEEDPSGTGPPRGLERRPCVTEDETRAAPRA